MMAGVSVRHLLIPLVVVVLLLGATRLPDMACAVSQSVRIFKGEPKTTPADEHTTVPGPTPAASPAVEHPGPHQPAPHAPNALTPPSPDPYAQPVVTTEEAAGV